MKTQVECWQALLNGKKLISKEYGVTVYIKDGKLFAADTIGGRASSESFTTPSYWEIYTEPKSKKKYWLWKMKSACSGIYYISTVYYDFYYLDTIGNTKAGTDYFMEKIEVAGLSPIEVEVEDGK